MDDKKELRGINGKFIIIPNNIILNKDLDCRRAMVISYFSCKATLDNTISFSLTDIMNWFGKKVDKHLGKNTCSENIVNLVNYFKSQNVIKLDRKFGFGLKGVNGCFDRDIFFEKNKGERFAKIYIDELQKIVGYKNSNPKDNQLDNSILLLVFAYLRLNIPVRNDLAGAEHRPDAYDTHYKTIGEELGVSERRVSKAISVLIKLGLIYERRRKGIYCYYVIQNKKKKKMYKEKTYIFCNTSKKIKNKGKTVLIAEGESYYLKEADDKEKMLDEYEAKIRITDKNK